jgi:hypothetical protein
MPREALDIDFAQERVLGSILSVARDLDVYPQWVAARLFVDFAIAPAALIIYRSCEGRIGVLRSKVDGFPDGLPRLALSGVRALLSKGVVSGPHPMCVRRKSGRGSVYRYYAEVAVQEASQEPLFGREQSVFVLLRNCVGS